ncbi:chloride channel protein [Amnibacterium kyonggiense]|uniref:CIC family chloride channel protein n=1 Tax=Amnibacterium kyonggiense TaxID=595671 RepID=A0A4R7FRD4_9MICO|nr:chloride channel protein [Amnibacterium kyonggiense]TDS80296.1 CIC family chloride channel protein [Amnibacterium kyonggiense]
MLELLGAVALPVLGTGILAGLGGAVVTSMLRLLQHVAYGYSAGDFLSGVSAAAPWVRVVALSAAGVLGAVGWWALRRWGSPVVPVEDAVQGTRMPLIATTASAGLQILIVGLGASIGREAAPRLLGGLAGDRIGASSRADPRLRRVLVAAGAGAGLAAVYNVPLGGALFAVEVVLGETTLLTVTAALVAALTATLVARIVVPDAVLYTVPAFVPTPSLLVLAVALGAVLGVLGLGFDRLAVAARRRRLAGWRILVGMPVVFLGVGVLAIPFPELLGNGRALAELSFEFTSPITLLLVVAVLKAVATVATVWSGAEGGLLTPSVSIGVALGCAAAVLWSSAWPGASIAGGAVVGGAAFLAATMRAPITAAVLVVEFTAAAGRDLLPILLAVAAATVARALIERRATFRERPALGRRGPAADS